MLDFGVIGFSMKGAGIPLGPFIIGCILATLAEVNLRSGLSATRGGVTAILTRPLACIFLVLTIILFDHAAPWGSNGAGQKRDRRP